MKDIKKEPRQYKQEDWRCDGVESYLRRQVNQNRTITIAESPPRTEGSESHIWLPSLAVLHQEQEPPGHPALKANGACLWET